MFRNRSQIKPEKSDEIDRPTVRHNVEEKVLGRRKSMTLGTSSLDMVLVPCALVIILSYHLLLYRRILRRPSTTVIGHENHNTLAWLRRAASTPEEAAMAVSVIADGHEPRVAVPRVAFFHRRVGTERHVRGGHSR
jgi:hypothetical protein